MSTYYFCPNPECENHKEKLFNTDWYRANGSYWTNAFGSVPRFKCKSCNRGFSNQTFSTDYYAKKVVDYAQILRQVSSAVNGRALSRNLNVSTGTIINRIDRLARQCNAFHTNQLAKVQLAENLAADGFESFCASQYFPNNINLLVGEKSQFVYFFNYVLMRRKGRMTEKQKAKCAALEEKVQYEEKAMEKAFGQVLETVKDLVENSKEKPVTLNTDLKPDYKRAIGNFPYFAEKAKAGEFIHNTTSSRALRIMSNPLFPVNYMDRELRKDQANHCRETVCFARNVSNMLNRMMVYCHWHNYLKPFRIGDKKLGKYQHGEQAGLNREQYTNELTYLLSRRRFLSFSKQVKHFWLQLWQKLLVTPLKTGRDYLPRYAMM